MPKKRSSKRAKKRAGKKPARRARIPRAKARRRRAKPAVPRKRTPRKKRIARRKPVARGRREGAAALGVPEEKGLGLEAAGQSGDIQGLAHQARSDSESVEELAEEGQAFEAEVVSGVENAPDADAAEVTTQEVPEDDVPPEYRETED